MKPKDGGAALTNEKVARALGYYVSKNAHGTLTVKPPHKKYPDLPSTQQAKKLPAFTTSLDAIVAEIEARGLYWECGKPKGGYWAWVGSDRDLRQQFNNDTAPLAICAALLAYLKESKNA